MATSCMSEVELAGEMRQDLLLGVEDLLAEF
jgi:hypothetical protein